MGADLDDGPRADVLRDADPLAAAVLLEAVDEARVLLGGPAACGSVLGGVSVAQRRLYQSVCVCVAFGSAFVK